MLFIKPYFQVIIALLIIAQKKEWPIQSICSFHYAEKMNASIKAAGKVKATPMKTEKELEKENPLKKRHP
jgi:hypothetical protein